MNSSGGLLTNVCRVTAVFVVLAMSVGSVWAEQWYRWTDRDGHIHYGDIPVQGSEKITFSNPPETLGASLPYETRRAMEAFPVQLYVVEDCGEPCQNARALLNSRAVPFTEQVLKDREEFEAFKVRSGSGGVPALTVGKTWIAGFKPAQWNSELDAAGYPGVAERAAAGGQK